MLPTDSLIVNPEMIILARKTRGLSQIELADRLGIGQSRLSKIEGGLLQLSAGELTQLAEALDYPKEFFGWAEPVYGFPLQEMFHRKRQKVTAKALATIHAQLNYRMLQLRRLLRSVEIDGDGFQRIDPDEFEGDVEKIAQAVRASWHLPPGPVKNLTNAIEDAGGIVIAFDFGTRHVDAVSQWEPGLPPVFFVNATLPGDRLRYTLAHELGHLIMHWIATENAEAEADRFAAEFLMPEHDIKHQLYEITLSRLAALKGYWKVSMAALLKRASDLGTVTARHARSLWMRMRQLGYHRQEPAPIPIEGSRLFKEMVAAHSEELNYSREELAIHLGDNHVERLFQNCHTHLTVVA